MPQAGDETPKLPATRPAETAISGIKKRRRKAWLRWPLMLLGVLAVAIGGIYFYVTGGRYVGTDNAYVKTDKVMVASEVTGLVDRVFVHENDRVAKGDVLFTIDDSAYRIALAEAEAKVQNARDQVASLKASYLQKTNELALSNANLKYAKSEDERQAKLVESKAVSRSQYESVRRDYAVARQRVAIIQQEMAQIRAELGGDPEIPVDRHPRYLEAAALRDRAALDLAHTEVRAPFDGIAGLPPNPGQPVTGNGPMSSPVMSLVADRGAWIEANYKETDLTHVKPGQEVTVHVDTYPDRVWHGEVQSISQATGAEFSVIPAQNATGNWVKVVQRIPVRIALDSVADAPSLRAGMSTTVEVDTKYRRPIPGPLESVLSWVGLSARAQATAGE